MNIKMRLALTYKQKMENWGEIIDRRKNLNNWTHICREKERESVVVASLLLLLCVLIECESLSLPVWVKGSTN